MKRKIFAVILAATLAFSSLSFAAENQVQANIPQYDVYLNSTLIDSTSAEYPMLEYKGITYMPMTWTYSNALGLTVEWTNESGLIINKTGQASELVQEGTGSNQLGSKCSVDIADFPITVNGQLINNAEEEYPILNYKGVTYFPLTWKYTVEAFGWKTEWNNETGLRVFNDGSQGVTINAAPVQPQSNLPFDLSFDIPQGWEEASKIVTEDVVDMGAKIMDISQEEIDLALQTRVAEMTMATKYPVTEPHPEGNPNLIFMVERSYSFDYFQTPEEYMDNVKMQLQAFGNVDVSQEYTYYTNPNGVKFVKQTIVNGLAGVDITQEYYVAKHENYFIIAVVTLTSTEDAVLMQETQSAIDSIHVK